MGVPADRIIRIAPGDSFEFKDIKVHAVESFDRTCLVTLPIEGYDENGGKLAGLPVTDELMARKAVNYVFETPGGTIYHGADSTSQTILQNTVVTSTSTLLSTTTVTTQSVSKTR